MSKTIYFYRVENEEREGPYHVLGRGGGWMESDHYNGPDHPSPNFDLGGYEPFFVPKTAIFGFRSLRQAQRWFSPTELRRLEKHGLRLKRVKGRLVRESKLQCCFTREEI